MESSVTFDKLKQTIGRNRIAGNKAMAANLKAALNMISDRQSTVNISDLLVVIDELEKDYELRLRRYMDGE